MTTKELKRLKDRCDYHTRKAVELRMKADEHIKLSAQYELQIRDFLNSK